MMKLISYINLLVCIKKKKNFDTIHFHRSMFQFQQSELAVERIKGSCENEYLNKHFSSFRFF